jgi:hypothetical protein
MVRSAAKPCVSNHKANTYGAGIANRLEMLRPRMS